MRLIGYADGIEVKFDFYPPNNFKAEIPKNISGIYNIELHAIDNAGNQTNMCDIAVLIDFDKLTFNILNPDIFEKTESEEFKYKELQQEFISKELI